MPVAEILFPNCNILGKKINIAFVDFAFIFIFLTHYKLSSFRENATVYTYIGHMTAETKFHFTDESHHFDIITVSVNRSHTETLDIPSQYISILLLKKYFFPE